MYYGNNSAVSKSNSSKVFAFREAFDDGSSASWINETPWNFIFSRKLAVKLISR
jgi:hypothetical protein